ncbi:MAG: hypothetical protein ACREWG_03550 [Gammaproteobacteria bacterium]
MSEGDIADPTERIPAVKVKSTPVVGLKGSNVEDDDAHPPGHG